MEGAAGDLSDVRLWHANPTWCIMHTSISRWLMRYVSGTFTVAFYRRDAEGRCVEVSRFPASSDMVAAYRLAPGAALVAARRTQRGQAIEGLRILCPAGRTVFQHPAVGGDRR